MTLDELKKLYEAQAGPWWVSGSRPDDPISMDGVVNGVRVVARGNSNFPDDGIETLIAATHNMLPRLIAVAEAANDLLRVVKPDYDKTLLPYSRLLAALVSLEREE